MIKISIVIPVYNVEQYIAKCLDSLVNQTLKEIELILVNDGSTDNSQAIIDEYAKKYPSKIVAFQKNNEGVSVARNFGLKHCRGEYIGFVDPDDYVELDMYESLYQEAKEESCDLVICDYIKQYTGSEQVTAVNPAPTTKAMFIGGFAAPWNKIYSRKLLEKSKAQFPPGLFYEDTEFFCMLIPYVERCGYVNKPFVHYVQRIGSTVNTQGTKVEMIFEIVSHILSFYRERNFYLKYKFELEYFCVRILLGSSMERICRCSDWKTRKKLYLKTWNYIEEEFPGWKKNPYLGKGTGKRSLYMRSVYRWNIALLGELFRLYFKRKDKKLYGAS